jgi:hypothetical protein
MEKSFPDGVTKGTGRHPKIFKSFFTKKLEYKLEQKGIEIPHSFMALMDKPFDHFSEEDRLIYESQFRALAYVFAELLCEVYQSMGGNRQGWEDMAERLEDTPAKIIAKLVISEEERLQEMDEEEAIDVPPTNARKKYQVKKYGAGSNTGKKERWWEKKIF